MIENIVFAFSAMAAILGVVAIMLMLVKGPPSYGNFPLPMPPMPHRPPPSEPQPGPTNLYGVGCCLDCIHGWSTGAELRCRRYPPTIRRSDDPRFPFVENNWYCGEFNAASTTVHTTKRTIKLRPGDVVELARDEEIIR